MPQSYNDFIMTYRVLLQGGLGNQLFQIAAGTYLKDLLDKDVIFDATLLTKVPKKIRRRDVEVAWLLDTSELKSSSFTTLSNLLLEKYVKNSILKEKDLNDLVLNRVTSRTKVISGYFHNYEYAEKTWPKISLKILGKLEESAPKNITNTKYLAVHFRGGDYLSDEKTRESHGVTGFNYFNNAIKKLITDSNIDKVVIVTDSPDFLRQNLSEFKNININISSSNNIYEDLAIIANSSGVVMSNSSFSWWGAFIANKISNAKIIAPTPWFTGKIDEPRYLIPKHWSVLERDIF
jgi:hypothetical protein